MGIVLFGIAIALNIHIVKTLSVNSYSPILIFEWLLSLLLLNFAFFPSRFKNILNVHFSISKKNLLVLGMIFLPSLVRICMIDITRLHGDEMLVGFFSSTHDFLKINFFSGIPQDKAQWQSQLPSLFFVFQRIFFLGFGETLLSIKLSIIPYILLISTLLFLSIRTIFGRKIASITLFVYSFLALSLYYETFGLIFISSTAVFMLFFYALILYIKKKNVQSIVFAGLSCGLCYLFYLTSYIAVFIMGLVFIFQIVRFKKIQLLGHLVLFLISFWIMVGPFITQAFLFDNYFITRTSQVSLLTGTNSDSPQKIAHGESPFAVLSDSTMAFLKSFYTNGIGGAGGFDFAHQAVFDHITFFLFIGGCILGFVWMFKKNEMILVFLILLGSFATVILAIPPPGYHRFTLAFPFIALILSLPFYLFVSIRFIPKKVRYAIGTIALVSFGIINLRYFTPSIQHERNNTTLQLTSFINTNYPGRNLYVAAFPGYVLEKLYYFSPNKKALSISTDYHDNLLKRLNPDEKYIYLVTMPTIFDEEFEKKDPNGRIMKYSNEFSLFFN